MSKWQFYVVDGVGDICSSQIVEAPTAADANFIWENFFDGKETLRDVEEHNAITRSGLLCRRVKMKWLEPEQSELVVVRETKVAGAAMEIDEFINRSPEMSGRLKNALYRRFYHTNYSLNDLKLDGRNSDDRIFKTTDDIKRSVFSRIRDCGEKSWIELCAIGARYNITFEDDKR